jgi:hypothetical protein
VLIQTKLITLHFLVIPAKAGTHKKYYAHSKEVTPPSEWQPLEVHLKNVAEMAKKFAEEFGAGDWGYLA